MQSSTTSTRLGYPELARFIGHILSSLSLKTVLKLALKVLRVESQINGSVNVLSVILIYPCLNWYALKHPALVLDFSRVASPGTTRSVSREHSKEISDKNRQIIDLKDEVAQHNQLVHQLLDELTEKNKIISDLQQQQQQDQRQQVQQETQSKVVENIYTTRSRSST